MIVLAFLGSMAAIGAALLAHELGHLAGGRIAGFRAYLLVIGPLRLERGGDGWRWRLNTDLGLAGGLAGAAPPDATDLRRRSALFVAGGPLASALVGGAALGAAWMLGRSAPGHLLVSLLVTLCLVSLAIAVLTLVPMRTSGFLSDGARLLQLMRGGPVAARDTAIQAIVGLSMSGVRPRDWDEGLVDRLLEPADGSLFEILGWTLMLARADDAGDEAEARGWLEKVAAGVDRFPPAVRPGVHLEVARQLASQGAIDEARRHLAAATGPAIGAPYLRPAAEAAVLAAEGRTDEALERVRAARAALAHGLDRGTAAAVASALDAIEARLTPSGRSSAGTGSTGTATS